MKYTVVVINENNVMDDPETHVVEADSPYGAWRAVESKFKSEMCVGVFAGEHENLIGELQ